MDNLWTFLKTILESILSLFAKKEEIIIIKPEEPIVKSKPKIEEPEKPIDKLIEELKEKIKEREEPKEPEEPKEIEVTFEDALKFVLKWEGFITNDPKDNTPGMLINELAKDPGGLTIWGISEKSHKEAVWKMYQLIQEGKEEEAFEIAENIYYEVYWLKSECDKLPSPINIIVFDTAVNMGRSRAKEFFDKCFEYNTDDNLGYFSWQDYLFQRIDFYTKCEKANLYLKGWINRVIDLYKEVK